MKQYEIVASKEVVATFSMNYDAFKMKFKGSNNLVAWIVNQHPELEDTPFHANFPDDRIVIDFYSIGNLVINEK